MTAAPGAGRLLIGLGVDTVDVARLTAMLERRPSMARRLFTPDELAYAGRMKTPGPSLAARFAAKEAAMKALGVGLGAFGFGDVGVTRQGLGPPALVVVGRAAELAAGSGVGAWTVSLTHTDAVATAVVAALA